MAEYSKRIGWTVVVVIMSGCAPWAMVGGPFEMNSQQYSVTLPDGWRRDNRTSDLLQITRDGLLLHEIRISRLALDKEVPHTKKKFAKGMPPQEVAELVIDSLRFNQEMSNLQIIQSAPAKVGGEPGFKLTYAYQTKQGLPRKAVTYGLIIGDWFYGLLYNAPGRYYFDRDVETFEKVKDSFTFRGIPTS